MPRELKRLLRPQVLVRLVGIALLVYLLSSIPLRDVARVLGQADPGLTALGIGLLFPFFLLKSWRWQLLLRGLGVEIPLPLAVRLYFLGLFAGHATPGQLGEAVKAWHLARRGHSLSSTLASIVADRLLDLVLLVALATLGLIVLGPGLGLSGGQAALVVALGVLLGGVLLLVTQRLRWLVGRWPAWERLSTLVRKLEAVRHVWPSALGLTLAAYLIHYLRFYGLLRALSLDMPIADFVAVLSLASLVTLLPVSVMGIGTRDVTLVGLLALYGIPAPSALAFSSLILLTFAANVAVGFAAWLWAGSAVPREAPMR